MRIGYKLSNGSTVHSTVTVHTVPQERCVVALSWSFLYNVQRSLLLENLLVITE